MIIKKQVILCSLFVVLLILSLINVKNYISHKQILGLETENTESDKTYWEEFIIKNPKYLPALFETGNTKKLNELDPNFIP